MSEELKQALEEENKTLRQMIDDLRTELREGRQESDREKIERELQLLEDPYANQRALKIAGHVPPDSEFPEGQVLRWLNPRLREGAMKGWVFVTKDDKYIEQIRALIGSDAPHRYDNEDIDNYVRRKDVILGRLDKRIWDSRRKRTALESMRRRGVFESEKIEQLGPGVTISGKGLKRDSTPKHVDKSRKTDSRGEDQNFLRLNKD